MNNKKNKLTLGLVMLGITIFTACKKNIPDERLSLGSDSKFTETVYTPILGRNSLSYNNFYVGSSSLPLNFKIVNMRRFNGEPAPELNDYFPVSVWKQAYDGTEKSIAEIEAKRTTENHRLFEIREHSGQFLMWAAANSNFVKAQPDSGYVFDVEVSNSGGRKYFKNLKLRPYRERPYEPSPNDLITGQATREGVSPSYMLNIRGERTGRYLSSNEVLVRFKDNGPGKSLSFKFLDTLQNTINPDKFNATKWTEVVHGFNMVKNTDSVKFDVAYPIPLAPYPTKYTTGDGGSAISIFGWERMGYGNIKEVAAIGLNFNIYEPRNWTIEFWFKTERPKFVND